MKPVLFAFALVLLLSSCMPPIPQTGGSVLEAWPTVTPSPIVTASETPYPTRTPLPACIVATGLPGGTVNIRSGPGMNYPVVDYAQEGEVLTVVTSPENGWAKVCNNRLVVGYFFVERWCQK